MVTANLLNCKPRMPASCCRAASPLSAATMHTLQAKKQHRVKTKVLLVDLVRMLKLLFFWRNILEDRILSICLNYSEVQAGFLMFGLNCLWSKCMQLAKLIRYLDFPSDHSSGAEQLAPATLWDSMDFPESLFQRQARENKWTFRNYFPWVTPWWMLKWERNIYGEGMLFWIFSGSLFLALFI